MQEIQQVSEIVYNKFKKISDISETYIYKPVPSPIDKIKGKYRWRIIIKGKLNSKLLNIIYKSIDCNVNDTSITVDINPNNMF